MKTKRSCRRKKKSTRKGVITKQKRQNNQVPSCKLYGGDSSPIRDYASPNGRLEDIQTEVQDEKDIFKNMNFTLVDKIKDLTKGVTIKSIEAVGNMTDVDFFDKGDINSKLEKIVVVITDPTTKAKFKEILKQYVDYGFILLEASEPFAKPMIEKGSMIMTDALSKLGEAATKILLNSLTEIPGFGVVIGSMRSLDSAGSAFLSVINASSQVIELSSDSINGAFKNFKQLMNEKTQIANRTENSITEFQG